MRRLPILLAACCAAVLVPSLGSAHPVPGAPKCPVFPAGNPWNERVDQLPVAANSARLIASIGLNAPVHPDFGTTWDGAPNGIPITIVSSRTRRVHVSFDYSDESDHGRYPIPRHRPPARQSICTEC